MISEVFKISTKIILTGSLYAFVGVMIDTAIYRAGIARKNTIFVIVFAYLWAFLLLAINEVSLPTYVFFYIILVTFGINQYDMWTTRKCGRWWWKSQEKPE